MNAVRYLHQRSLWQVFGHVHYGLLTADVGEYQRWTPTVSTILELDFPERSNEDDLQLLPELYEARSLVTRWVPISKSTVS